MKVFFVTALALCYFLAESQVPDPNPNPNPLPHSNFVPNFHFGDQEKACLKKLGFQDGVGGPNDQGMKLHTVCTAYDYYRKSMFNLLQYNSVKVDGFFSCVPWRNIQGALTKKEKRCIKKSLPDKGGIRQAQLMINDVNKAFLAAANGNTGLKPKVVNCLDQKPPKVFKGLSPPALNCAKNVVGAAKADELSYGLHYFRTDIEYAGAGFGESDVSRYFTELLIVTLGDLWKRISNGMHGGSVFDPEESRKANRYLPGQSAYIDALIKRFSTTLGGVVGLQGAVGNSATKRKVDALGKCIDVDHEILSVHSIPAGCFVTPLPGQQGG